MYEGIMYLNSLGQFDVWPGLERIQSLLSHLGSPQNDFNSIIVGGTNGKGSVGTAISSVLVNAGYKTALYTSPHLVRLTERIRINGAEISDGVLKTLLLEIRENSIRHGIGPNYVEALTAAAFWDFARDGVQWAVLEVGMGGRWDATNVVKPALSVITNVSFDHMSFLGNSIREIAGEKAGIIKEGVPVVTGAQGEAADVIREKAESLGSPAVFDGRDFSVTGNTTDDFSYNGAEWSISNLEFGLMGTHQLENAAVAMASFETLSKSVGLGISEQNVKNGLKSVELEGRFEVLSNKAFIILDGAHNTAGARALVESLRSIYGNKKFVFMIAMNANKEHGAFIERLTAVAERIIFTELSHEARASASELGSGAAEYVQNYETISEPGEALRTALSYGKPLCITGSLYLIGEIKQLIEKNPV